MSLCLPVLVALSVLVVDPYLQDGDRDEEIRREWEEMSEEEQQDLLDRYQRWKDLSEEEREEIRKRHEKLKEMPDEERRKLRGRFDRYRDMKEMFHHRWNIQKRFLDQLPEEERQRIEALPRAKRQKEIEKLLRTKWAEKMKAFVAGLPPETQKELEGLPPEKWRRRVGKLMEEDFAAKVQAFVDSLPEETRKELDSLPEEQRRRRVFKLMWGKKRGPWGKGKGHGRGPLPPTDEEIEAFVDSLPIEKKQELDRLSPQERRAKVLELMRERDPEKFGPPPRRRGGAPDPFGPRRR